MPVWSSRPSPGDAGAATAASTRRGGVCDGMKERLGWLEPAYLKAA